MSNTLGPYLLGPNAENQGVYTGDARELAKAIPDESVSLIFCDPVYQNIDDYRWLAETASRVLREGGNLVAYVAWTAVPHITQIFLERFRYCDLLIQRETARRMRNWGLRVNGLCEVAIWVSKGQSVHPGWVTNFLFVSNGYCRSDKHHDWEKLEQFVTGWIEPLSEPNAVVWDPYTGGGTVPAVCKMLGRRWLAFEIDPDVAERARERIRNTQPPLPGLVVPQQKEMSFP